MADGNGVREEAIGSGGDGVRLGVGSSVGLGEGSTAVGVEGGSPVAQLATRPIPIAATNTTRPNRLLNPVRR